MPSGQTSGRTATSWARAEMFQPVALFPIVLFVFAYYPAVRELVSSWSTNQTYAHGFLVPFVSVAIIWMRRETLRHVPFVPSLFWGTTVCVTALSMLVIGRFASVMLLEQFALLLTICGLTTLLLGYRMLRALAFPLAYLLAMIPHWDVFTAWLHPIFQDRSATIGVWMLNGFGIPVFRSGVLLHLPNITLEVAEACSGVNNLIAILCVGLAMTHLYVRRWRKRAAILAATVAIALLGNGVRVGLICVLAYFEIRGVDGNVHGPFELLRTMIISGLGFVAVFWLVSRFGDHDAASRVPTLEGKVDSTEKPRGPGLRRAAYLVAIVILLCSASLGAWHRLAIVPTSTELGVFPIRVGHWQWTGREYLSELALLDFDQTLSRVYATQDGTELRLFIGHYDRQANGTELAGDLMRQALPAPTTEAYIIRLGETAEVTDLLQRRGDQIDYVSYWYVVNGRTVAKDFEVKLHTLWSTLFRQQSAGSLVAVTTRHPDNEPIETSRRRVQAFLQETIEASEQFVVWRP